MSLGLSVVAAAPGECGDDEEGEKDRAGSKCSSHVAHRDASVLRSS